MEQSPPRIGQLSGLHASGLPLTSRAASEGIATQGASDNTKQHRVLNSANATARILRHLHRGWKKIALACLVGLMLGQTYLWNATPFYSSTASLLFDQRAPDSNGSVPSDFAYDDTFLESQVAIIRSSGVLKKAIEKLKLADDAEFGAEGSPRFNRLLYALFPGRTVGTPAHRALSNLGKALVVARVPKTYIIEMTATTQSPAKSAAVVSAVIDAYLADLKNAHERDAEQGSHQINAHIEELRNQLRHAESLADEHKKSGHLIAEGNFRDQHLIRSDADLVAARNAETDNETLLIARLREQRADVFRRKAALSSQLHSSHPDIIEVRSQLASVEAQIAAELARIAATTDNNYRAAATRVEELEKQVEKANQDLAEQTIAQNRQHDLDRDVAKHRDMLITALSRATTTQNKDAAATPTARVITSAVAENVPSHPRPLFALPLGLLSGLAVGVLWTLRSRASTSTVDIAAHLNAQPGIADTSVIPLLKRSSHPFLRTPNDAANYSDMLSALDSLGDTASEAYRQSILRLMSKIRSLGRAGRPNTVMFISARRNAGNSATVLATAHSAARSGERVLLVDATSTDADLSNVFAMNLSPSTTVLLDNKEHLTKIVTRDDRTGVSLLPIALADLRTLRVQQRRRLVAGINLLSQDFDWIFIDAGGLLDDEAVTTLLPASDLVFIVARCGVTSLGDVDDMLQNLGPARERIAGAILTFGPA